MARFLTSLGTHKDGITTFLALFAVLVGFFQYFDFRAETRIKYAVEILERREKSELLRAEADFNLYWKQGRDGVDQCNKSRATNNGAERPKNEIKTGGRCISSGDYRVVVSKLSVYYNSISSCALGNICDRIVVCSSMSGTVQRYLRLNKSYFRSVAIDEEAVAARKLVLSLPEFVELCLGQRDFTEAEFREAQKMSAETGKPIHSEFKVTRGSVWSKASLYTNGVRDSSLSCRTSLWLERMFGLGISFACSDKSTKYHQIVFR
ncbi:hypothetical protein [Thalassococcus lentus]|uniref:Uncharacterized protein n=1 Tax=Thalassococcus lentus TaxID=1210524 RepID=A0ABT4XV67_9RHOB|nr:hypothetical protein [Thalassococcus lentus]MDA7425698.1 hypothetical protein [Thalassococcus lentus]